METVITSYCRITNNCLIVNGKTVTIENKDAITSFFSEIYKILGISYPKFHKMDSMCKLGFLAAEAALKDSGFFERNNANDTGIVLTNRSSSLDTDKMHQKSINSLDAYLPSPSVFVYTLANIVIGEIAIKNKITGENAFFVTNTFDPKLLVQQNNLLLNSGDVNALISGWVDYENNNADALIYLAENLNDSIKNINFKPLNEITLKQLY